MEYRKAEAGIKAGAGIYISYKPLWHSKVGMFMFERMKEAIRRQQEKREQQIREEKNRLLSLSEKELLVEILLELKRIDGRIDDVETSVRIYHN